MKFIAAALFGFILSADSISGTTINPRLKQSLTQKQAIELAEKFIIDNGYTNLPPNKSNLKYELPDQYKKNIDDILKQRRNTLQTPAFCIGEEEEEWHVGFLFSKIDVSKLDSIQQKENLRGRAVIVNKDGSEIILAHKDPLFSRFKKL